MSETTGLGGVERMFPGAVVTRGRIFELIDAELEAVERLFRRNLASPLRIVDEIGQFVAEGNGKRVRPTLHLLSAKLCRYEGPHDVLLATVLEFIHSATLIHDDIIDEAETRRGRPSVNAGWGNDITVLFGDYLFAKAMEMALQAGNLEIMDRLADVTLRMTEGEMLQTRYVGRLDLGIDEYLQIVERKTAALFACCCELAAILAGVDGDQRRALHRYGLNLGLAFQLVDDLLDFTGDAETMGKPAASDLREGKATLAVLDLLSRSSSEARELARGVMVSGDGGDPRIARLTEMLHTSGAIRRARRRAGSYAETAIRELGGFRGDRAARRALEALPDLLLDRDR